MPTYRFARPKTLQELLDLLDWPRQNRAVPANHDGTLHELGVSYHGFDNLRITDVRVAQVQLFVSGFPLAEKLPGADSQFLYEIFELGFGEPVGRIVDPLELCAALTEQPPNTSASASSRLFINQDFFLACHRASPKVQ